MIINDGHWLADAVAMHWQHYRKRLQACRQQASEDAVHKLRISLRRMLAMVGLAQSLAPHPQLITLRKALKAQLNSLSELRDVQVMRLESEALIAGYPQLEPFLHQLHLRELELLIRLPSDIAAWRSGKLLRKLCKIDRHCRCQPLDDATLQQRIMTAIDEIFQQARQREAALDNNDLASFHRLRVVIKKLRYSLELAAEQLNESQTSQLPAIKHYQDALGEIQNAEVFQTSLVEAFAGELPEVLRLLLADKQQQLLAEFLQQRQQLASFWQLDQPPAEAFLHPLV